VISGYEHYLGLASRLQWDAEQIDLSEDAAAWARLDAPTRAHLLQLVAGFCVGEASVADELDPFVRAARDGRLAACFRAQARDEARHARFFDRVAEEVVGVPGSPAQRRSALRGELDPRFLELFEQRLPALGRALAAREENLDDAVGLYHMVLEGVVFVAGQLAVLELVDGSPLAGLRSGVELVLRDERWHVGFGTRRLLDARVTPDTIARILAEGQDAASVWVAATGPRIAAHVAVMLRRRLAVIGTARRPDAPPEAVAARVQDRWRS
jgi:ribonucleoside-diphosphate reductase beta chain